MNVGPLLVDRAQAKVRARLMTRKVYSTPDEIKADVVRVMKSFREKLPPGDHLFSWAKKAEDSFMVRVVAVLARHPMTKF